MTRRSWSLLASALLLAAPSAPTSASGARDGEVRALSLVAAPGRAEPVIQVQGTVDITDRTLTNPNRIVLDLAGATLAPGAESAYDGVKRAGVLNMRVKQFTPTVVRVVLDVEQLVPYRVERSPDAIRVSFGSEQAFLAWNGGTVTATRAVAAPAEPVVKPAVAPAYEAPAPAASRAQGRQNTITVSWNNASIEDVILGFQAVSGRSIILGKDIKRTITA